ncbi:MAG: hypothetical protein J1E59_00490 [Treponema sp.]|nr:hypothetical protein [Treponema sp.]
MRKHFSRFAILFVFAAAISAQGGWNFESNLDFIYYPESDFVSGSTHFAPVSGIFKSVGLQETFCANYVIPTPFGEGALVKDSNVSLGASLIFSPVTIMPTFSVSFAPIAFLNLSAGAAIGTGWQLFNGTFEGFLGHDGKDEYKQFDGFRTWLYQFWGNATLMFDVAAVAPGEWNHVVALASFDFRYWGILGEHSGIEVFKWQNTANLAQGVRFDINVLVGYQMPIKLSMVGINFEWSGYFKGNEAFGKKYEDFNGDFVQVDINPLAQISFTEKDILTIMLNFSSRRSFKEDHQKEGGELSLHYSGREWFFNMVAFRWTHKF